MPPSKAVLISFTVIPMTTGLFSIIGSSTIMAMIFVSKKKFGDPYRRIVFGISFFDLLQSLAIFFKIFKTTDEQPNAWIALGNQTSCDVLGFVHFAGLNGALLYNVSLNIYLLCLIKYNMTAGYFRKFVEPFLHGVPIIWAIVSASTIVGTGHMNPGYPGECVIAPYPVNCLANPDVECIRGEHKNLLRTLFRVMPTFGSFGMILVTLGMLWWSVRAQEKKMDRYRMSMVSSSLLRSTIARRDDEAEEHQKNNLQNFLDGMTGGFKTVMKRLSRNSGCVDDRDAEADANTEVPLRRSQRGSYPSQLPRRRSSLNRSQSNGRHFLTQAKWFVVAFVLTHTCPIIVVCAEWGGGKPPLAVLIVAKFLVPLQGLFNIIVYTRPHVHKERVKNRQLSWWGAFKIVVASGGDDDDERTNRLREGVGARRGANRHGSGRASGSSTTSGRRRSLFSRVSGCSTASGRRSSFLSRRRSSTTSDQPLFPVRNTGSRRNSELRSNLPINSSPACNLAGSGRTQDGGKIGRRVSFEDRSNGGNRRCLSLQDSASSIGSSSFPSRPNLSLNESLYASPKFVKTDLDCQDIASAGIGNSILEDETHSQYVSSPKSPEEMSSVDLPGGCDVNDPDTGECQPPPASSRSSHTLAAAQVDQSAFSAAESGTQPNIQDGTGTCLEEDVVLMMPSVSSDVDIETPHHITEGSDCTSVSCGIPQVIEPTDEMQCNEAVHVGLTLSEEVKHGPGVEEADGFSLPLHVGADDQHAANV